MSTVYGFIEKNPIAVGVAVVAVLGVAAYTVYRVLDINKGTPYEGGGVVGTLGNLTNQVLGGAPQAIGEALGSAFAPDESGANLTYAFTFPDGTRGAVNSNAVDSQGYFNYSGTHAQYRGQNFELRTLANGNHIAVKT